MTTLVSGIPAQTALSCTTGFAAAARRSRRATKAATFVVFLALITIHNARTFAGVDQWTSSGPGVAEVDRIIADPAGSGTMFAESRGQVFRSTDSGATWYQTTLPFLGDRTLSSFVVDALKPEVLLALFAQRPWQIPILPQLVLPRLYRTEDRGATWDPVEVTLGGIAVSRSSPGTLYGAGKDRLYVSFDGGRSWTPRGAFPEGYWRTDYPGFQLAVSVSQSEVIWVAGISGILRSTDGGWTWSPAGLNGRYVLHFVVCGPTGNVALAGDETELWRSTDSGVSWVGMGWTGVRRMIADPTRSSTLYAIDTTHLYRSPDAGQHWETLLTADPDDFVSDLAVAGGGSPMIYVASRKRGLLSSADDVTWNPVDIGVYSRASSLVIDPAGDTTLYASAGQFFGSTDAGKHWAPLAGGASVLSAVDLVAGPPGTLYAVAGPRKNKVYKSTYHAVNWWEVLDAASYSLEQVHVAANEPNIVYVVGHKGIHRSRDGGLSWTYLTQGLPADGIMGLSIDPTDSRYLLAATGSGLLRSTNGGDFWTSVPVLSGVHIASVAFHPRLSGVAFASAASIVHMSWDRGVTWWALAGLGENVGRICFDPLRDDTVFVASPSYLYRGNVNDGSWARFTPGRGFITDLAVSATLPTTLHVATEWGVYSLTPESSGESDFEISQTVLGRAPDGLVTYKIRVTNRGPADFVGAVKVQDRLPDAITFVSALCPGWQTEAIGYSSEIFLHEGLYPAGQVSEITIRARPEGAWANIFANQVLVVPLLPVDAAIGNNTAVAAAVDRRSRPSPVSAQPNRGRKRGGAPSR